MLEFNTTISFPAAPLLTVILALVGKLERFDIISRSHHLSENQHHMSIQILTPFDLL
jgi:hypothetical protein